MGSVDVSIYYDQHRVDAMERILRSQGRKLSEEIEKQMDALYQIIVPEQERIGIEEKIRQEDIQRAAENEAARRFALVHLHDAETDYHLLTELHNEFIHSARLYRVVTKDIQSLLGRGGKSSLSLLNQMRLAYIGHEPLTPEAFSKLVESAPNDHRITAMVEFDFENYTVSACESSDNHWWTYNLKDVCTAVFYADRRSGISNKARREIFDNRLEGKEIDFAQEEDLAPADEPDLRM